MAVTSPSVDTLTRLVSVCTQISSASRAFSSWSLERTGLFHMTVQAPLRMQVGPADFSGEHDYADSLHVIGSRTRSDCCLAYATASVTKNGTAQQGFIISIRFTRLAGAGLRSKIIRQRGLKLDRCQHLRTSKPE